MNYNAFHIACGEAAMRQNTLYGAASALSTERIYKVPFVRKAWHTDDSKGQFLVRMHESGRHPQ